MKSFTLINAIYMIYWRFFDYFLIEFNTFNNIFITFAL